MRGPSCRVVSVATVGLLLACGAAFAPAAQAAPAGCGNNIADYTVTAFTIATAPVTDPPEGRLVTVNSNSTVTYNGNIGAFGIAASTLAVGGSGTVRMTLPVTTGGPFPLSYSLYLTPTCLVGTTVRQLSGTGRSGGVEFAATLSRASL